MSQTCPTCKGTDIDDYGCMDCFLIAGTEYLEAQERENVKDV